MPTADSSTSVDTDRDREKEREADRHERGDKSGSKQKQTSSSTKAKDLSHVPCKFFKVGACTAGSSCPFSHASAEPGAQKEPCAWFVKGNCKFGHKCALAHILPGQSMSMDRKNKKAAQQAAAGSTSGGGGEKGGKEMRRKRDGQGGNSTSVPGRNNTLLAGGSTAPTRLLSSNSTAPASNRPPMPLKASISPSAPAPPLKDTDFASFAALDEMEGVQLPVPPAHGKSPAPEAGASTDTADGKSQSTPSPVPLPTSAPRVTTAMIPSEFGPIGSPPSASRGHPSAPGPINGTFTPGTSPRGPSHLNGLNLGTSPQNGPGFMSSSPFSAPGSQSVFMNNSYAGHGVAASLGAMMGGRRGWGDVDVSASPAQGGLSMLSSSVQRSSLLNGNARGEYGIDLEYEEFGHGGSRRKLDSAVEDGDMEDFIPGSLTDLLTPEERSRRMSRGGSSAKPLVSGLTAGAPSNHTPSDQQLGTPATAASRLGHRYSSSVPAPSLLGDIKSIWSDTSALPGSPPAVQPGTTHTHTHRATPSASFVSRFEGLTVSGPQGANNDDVGMSMSMGSTGAASSLGMLSPSNASAAFLGLHHNYLKSKTSQQQQQQQQPPQPQLGLGGGLSRGFRGASGPMYPPAGGANTGGGGGNMSTTAAGYGMGGANQGYPASANVQSTLSQLPSYRGAPSPFDLTQPMHQTHHLQSSRPMPNSDSSNVGNNNKRLGGVGLGFNSASGGLGIGMGVSGHGTNGGGGPGGTVGAGMGIDGKGAMANLESDQILTGQFLSPNSRALQAHAPGQSLPQGLAAGYSRIHALPPLVNLTSPSPGATGIGIGSVSGGVVPAMGVDGAGATPGLGPIGHAGSTTKTANPGLNSSATIREEWGVSSLPPQTSPLAGPPSSTSRNATPAPRNGTPSMASTLSNLNAPPYTSGVAGASPGLESVLSKLSYSAAAKSGPTGIGVGGGGVPSSPTPPGLMKGGGRYPSGLSTPGLGHGLASGGGGGVTTGSSNASSPLRPREDDDELFAMDNN
ncbi:hypothetical protein D9756_006408 [Leucocoprinus leucothites]|uniref:C3H1-type domain-containing protein n=1 Tax=Leucocoprinus leucothites TaxID=201217 RepID=A0A8H5G227_9AGAR|nr:hypothetical protein D9756_006408 [Leucoagaricus leucothites]